MMEPKKEITAIVDTDQAESDIPDTVETLNDNNLEDDHPRNITDSEDSKSNIGILPIKDLQPNNNMNTVEKPVTEKHNNDKSTEDDFQINTDKNSVNNDIDIEQDETKDAARLELIREAIHSNVIILGSVKPKESMTSSERRRRCINDLKILDGMDNGCNKFDGMNDSYKKYRLRDVKKPDYRIPTSINFETGRPKKRKEHQDDNDMQIHCNICNHIVFTELELRSHIRTMHKTKFTCSICHQIFDTNNQLLAHKTVHEKEEIYHQCFECKLAFSNQYDFLVHEAEHSKTKTYTCAECSLPFGKNYFLHLATHFNIAMTCHICSEVFNGRTNLRNHIKSHSKEKKFECVECGQLLKDKKYFDYHMALHTGVKKYQCLYCGKGFRVVANLKVHTRYHTNEKPFQCKICDKLFMRLGDMLKHEARHNEIKSIKCDNCDKIFKYRNDLVYHKRLHCHKNQMYECPDCKKRFSNITGLKSHVLYRHTTERTVDCKYCNKSFKNNNQYQKHSRSIYHENNVFKASLNKKDK